MKTQTKTPVAAIALLAILAGFPAKNAKADPPEQPKQEDTDAKINDDTVLFNFRGQSIKAKDLPGRSLSCRMYVAKRNRQNFLSAMRQEYGNGIYFNPVAFLSRLTFQIVFDPGWDSATVWAQSTNYIFHPLNFDHYSGLGVTSEYDVLKTIDPDHSPDPHFQELARKALKKTWTSDIYGIKNLQLKFAPLSKETVAAPGILGNAIHIYDRVSDPRFYLRVSETSDPVNDEWLPQLLGDQQYLKNRVIPNFGATAIDEGLDIVLGATTVGMLVAPIDWSGSAGMEVGAYCYVGAPADLDVYEQKPLGRKNHPETQLNN